MVQVLVSSIQWIQILQFLETETLADPNSGDLIDCVHRDSEYFWIILVWLLFPQLWTLQEKVQNKSALLQSHLPMPPLPQRRRGSYFDCFIGCCFCLLHVLEDLPSSSCFRTLYLILKNDMIWSDKTSNSFAFLKHPLIL